MSAKPIRNSLAAPGQTLSGRIKAFFQRVRRLMPTRAEARRQRALRWLGPLLQSEWLWRMNRRAVASGVALGVFFGLIVPVAQIPFAAAGALLMRANLPAAALATLVSNPLTVAPIYWLAHRTGAAILEPSGSEQVVAPAADDLEAAHITSADWIQRIADVGAPLMLGLSLFAACGAVLAYLAVRLIWRWSVLWQRRRPRAFSETDAQACLGAVASKLTLGRPSMTAEERKSILSIALHAAFADGLKHEREREEIRSIVLSLAGEAGSAELAPIYQDVLLNRVMLEAATAALTDLGMRQLAYEMAVCVCDADGRQSEAEHRFLVDLKELLRLDPGDAVAFEREADAIVDLAESAAPVLATGSLPISLSSVATAHSKVPEGELDKSILNYALVNGALELLPQSWASMAIIPLQIKMVYSIGKAHGVDLDQGHIKEFIAAAGVGLTSQYLEQFARKLLGGLIGKAAGKTAGNFGRAATGMAVSFATTYALGQLAKRYYAGGRTMNTTVLRDTFQSLMGPARQMQTQYMPQIQQQAETLDMGRVIAMVRGA